MHQNKKFERSAKIRQFKAFLLTAILTGVLTSAILLGTGTNIQDILPEIVKKWIDSEEASSEDVAMKP